MHLSLIFCCMDFLQCFAYSVVGGTAGYQQGFFFCSETVILCCITFLPPTLVEDNKKEEKPKDCCRETSVLKQRFFQIQRPGTAYLTSAACYTFADAWGRTLRKCSFGLKSTTDFSFLSQSPSDAHVLAAAHGKEAAVFSVKP